MQVIDLFSGIAGFSVAAHRLNWRTIQFCERDKFCRTTLACKFPSVPISTDINKLTATQIKNNGLYDPNEPTVFVGGIPCQPWSLAGKRKGEHDDRNLWPQTIDLVREFQPDYCLFENVHGLITWKKGMAFNKIIADLENAGYIVTSFIIPACAVNAPHRRDRVWIVAYSNKRSARSSGTSSITQSSWSNNDGITQSGKQSAKQYIGQSEFSRNATNATGNGNHRASGESGEEIEGSHGNKNKQPVKRGKVRPIAYTSGEGYQHGKPGQDRSAKSASEANEFSGERIRSDVSGTRNEGNATNAKVIGMERSGATRKQEPRASIEERVFGCYDTRTGWRDFPTVSPLRMRNDGFSGGLVRYVEPEFYTYIKDDDRIDLEATLNNIGTPAALHTIMNFYGLHDPELFFQVMRLYSSDNLIPFDMSPFADVVSKFVMKDLKKSGSMSRTSMGKALLKKMTPEVEQAMNGLPHEIAVAAKRFEFSVERYKNWHNKESVRALGNAIVPDLAYEIFSTIEEFHQLTA